MGTTTETNPFDAYGSDSVVAAPPPTQETPTGAGNPPPASEDKNPFDSFDGVQQDVMKEAPAPTPGESLTYNFQHALGGLTKQSFETAHRLRSKETVRSGTVEGTASEPGEKGKVTQHEYDRALGDLAVQDANRRRWDRFESEGFWGKTAAFVGGAAGGLLDPVNLLPMGVAINVMRGIATAVGAGKVISTIAGHAGGFGAFTAAADATSQGLDIAAGYQTGYDAQRTVMAGALGAGLGGSMAGAAFLIKALRGDAAGQAQQVAEGLALTGKAEGPLPPFEESVRDWRAGGERPAERPPEHGFDDAVRAETERLDETGGRPEEARAAAFEREVGERLSLEMEATSIPPEHLEEIRSYYKRADGESVDDAVYRAIDEYVARREQPAAAAADPVLKQELEQAEPAPRSEQPPEGWQPTTDQLAEARRLSLGWPARVPEGRPPASLTSFVRAAGGLDKASPEAADLLSQDIGRQPGLLRNRVPGDPRAARGYDEMARAAQEAGYDLGPDLATGNGVNAARFMEMLQEDASGQRKHYPAGRDTEAHFSDVAYNAETKAFLENTLGVRPKGMDPRQIAWLLSQERNNERAIRAAHQAGRRVPASGRERPGEQADIPFGDEGKPTSGTVRRAGDQTAPEVGRAAGGETGSGAAQPAESVRGERVEGPAERPLIDAPEASADTLAARERAAQKEEAEARMRGRQTSGRAQESAEDTPLFGGERQGDIFDAQALRGRAATPQGPAWESRRLSVRTELPGEAATAVGPRAAVTDQEARGLKLTESMNHIAEMIGRRLETDGRFTLRGVLGEYKPKQGVLRIRYSGDMESFAHELGHAIDQRLAFNDPTKVEWAATKAVAPSELLAMDFNAATSGGTPSIAEGAAEFLRTYVTNPAYATAQAPRTASAFKLMLQKDPELAAVLQEASRMSQVESGLNPTQVFTTMIADGERSGLERLSRSASRYGIVETMKDYATKIYGGLIRQSVWVDRAAQFLRDARFEKTGAPIRDLSFTTDPGYHYRQLPGAQQSAVGIIDKGVPLNVNDPFGSARSPSLTSAVARALNGSFSRLENDRDPLTRAFNGYLIARRGVGEWDRFEAGELRNQPVRASKNETIKAVEDFEKEYPNFKQAADDFYSFGRAFLQRRVDKGFLKQEQADQFIAARGDYVPFFRDFGEDRAGAGRAGGPSLEHQGLHEFGGSTRDILNPVRSTIEYVAQFERRFAENDMWRAFNNLAAEAREFAGPLWERVPNTDIRSTTVDAERVMRDLARKNGMNPTDTDTMITGLQSMVGPDMTATLINQAPTTSRGQRIVYFWEGGERQAAKLGDSEVAKHLYDLATSMSEPEKDIFFKMMGAVNAGFQSAITHAPRFLLGTAVRDNMTRMFIPRFQGLAGRVPFVQDLVGAYTMMVDRAFYRAYQSAGGIRGGLYSHASRELGEDALKAASNSSGFLTRTLDELESAGTLGAKAAVIATVPANMVRSAGQYGESLVNRVRYRDGLPAQGWAVLTTPFKMVGDLLRLAEMTETASRVGNAKLTYNYLKKQGLNDVEAFSGGMYESRDVLNYNSRGDWTAKMGRTFPFLQAGITGADRSARGLIGEPVMAAARAYERGGWSNLDAKDQAILSAAWKNWLYIGANAALIPTVYYPAVHDSEFYRRASAYMRDTYYLLQTGTDADGNPVGLTIHKGYDVPAAIANTAERLAEEMHRSDPTNWLRIFGGLKEALPRQFRSATGLMEGAPLVKTSYEIATGQRLGMEGSAARPIVPERLRGKPLEQQITATTSYFAKELSKDIGVSPLVVDHVINGLGGTGGQDIRDLSSAVFDNNPLNTVGDAMNRFFFGQIYRTARTDVGARHDLSDLMARDHGKYQLQSNAYVDALERGDRAEADSVYNRADSTAKTLMTLQSSNRFNPDIRGLHPLIRSEAISSVIGAMMRDLGQSRILIQERQHQKGTERKVIELSQEQARQTYAQLNAIVAEELRNGLTMSKQPGYEDYSILDTQPRVEILRGISPLVAAEYQKRMAAKHVLSAQGVADQWAETQRRLLQDGRSARLVDLVGRARQTRGAPIAPMTAPPP